MTVGKLIKELQKLNDPNLDVVLSRDAEGNNFRELAEDGIGIFWYDPDRYEITNPEDLAEEDKGEKIKRVPNAVVLWPED